MSDRDHRFREAWHRAFLALPELPSASRLLGLVIASHARADGTRAVVPQATLATEMGLTSDRSVRRALGWLVAHGWIRQDTRGRKGYASVYRLTSPSTGQSGDRLGDSSAGHSGDRLSLISTGQVTHLNRTFEAVQPDTQGVRLPSSSPRDTPRPRGSTRRTPSKPGTAEDFGPTGRVVDW